MDETDIALWNALVAWVEANWFWLLILFAIVIGVQILKDHTTHS